MKMKQFRNRVKEFTKGWAFAGQVRQVAAANYRHLGDGFEVFLNVEFGGWDGDTAEEKGLALRFENGEIRKVGDLDPLALPTGSRTVSVPYYALAPLDTDELWERLVVASEERDRSNLLWDPTDKAWGAAKVGLLRLLKEQADKFAPSLVDWSASTTVLRARAEAARDIAEARFTRLFAEAPDKWAGLAVKLDPALSWETARGVLHTFLREHSRNVQMLSYLPIREIRVDGTLDSVRIHRDFRDLTEAPVE